MKSIIRSYVIVTTIILSVVFLAIGVISVNEETSYVISGEKQEVLRVQSTTSERLIVSSDEETEILSVSSKDMRNVTMLLAGVLPSPFSQIVWGLM